MSRARPERMIAIKAGDRIAKLSGPAPALLTPKAAAKAMGIGVDAVRTLIRNGTIYSIEIGPMGKQRRVPWAEVEKWRVGGYAHERQDSGPFGDLPR